MNRPQPSVPPFCGDVAGPNAIWSARCEVPRQQVFSHCKIVLAVRGDDEFPLASGLDAMRFHELLHAIFAHPDASRQQLLPYSWPSVFAFDFGVDSADVRQQRFIAVAPARKEIGRAHV